MISESMQISKLDVIDNSNNNDDGGFFFDFDGPENIHKSATKAVVTTGIFAELSSYTYLEEFPWIRIGTACPSQLRKWYSLHPNKDTEGLPELRVINKQNENLKRTSKVHKSKLMKCKMETPVSKKHKEDDQAMQTKPMELILESSLSSSTSLCEHELEERKRRYEEQHRAYIICYQSPPSTSLLTLNNTEQVNTSATTLSGGGAFVNHEERDIIPGKYYGGLKVWSCAPMLARYLVEHEQEWRAKWSSYCNNMKREDTHGETHSFDDYNIDSCDNNEREGNQCIVMDVGCGQGLCGLAAMCLGANHIIFQDYNEEVLTSCVQPNIAATLIRNNENKQDVQNDCSLSVNSPAFISDKQLKEDVFEICTQKIEIKLVHGDWAHLSAHTCNTVDQNNDINTNCKAEEHGTLESDMCDVILGSDVTFDEEACAKLSALLCRILKPKTGVALIASKEYYFGTNGGVWEFTQQATRHGLRVTEVHRETEAQTSGMQQVIVQVTRP